MKVQLKRLQRGTILTTEIKNYVCTILGKTVATFYLCPKNLPEAKWKSNKLISLVEEISRQPDVDSAL